MIDTAVFDLDGILLKDMVMTEGGMAAVKELLEAKWKVLYSSGKNYWFTVGGLSFANLMRPDTTVIAENGGVVFFPSTKEKLVLSSHGADVQTLEKAYTTAHCERRRGLLIHRNTGTALWQEPKETIFTIYPNNVEMIPALGSELRGLIEKDGLNLYVIEHSDAIDVLPVGQNKGASLAYLENEGLIDLGCTAAFGDGSNDLEMLDIVAMPMTVDNAKQSVKELVLSRKGYVAKGSYGNGVLEGVRWLTGAV